MIPTTEEEDIAPATYTLTLKGSELTTGADVNAYVATLDETIQKRFKDLQTRTGITIPDNDKNLCSAQWELVLTAI